MDYTRRTGSLHTGIAVRCLRRLVLLPRTAAVGLLGLALWVAEARAASGDERIERARQEVERQLREMVRIPPPKVEIWFEGLDEPNHQVIEVELHLDGRPRPVSEVSRLSGQDSFRVYSGELAHGMHELVTWVVIQDTASALFSEHAGFKWRVGAKAEFQAQRGLSVRVKIRPELVANAKDPKQKFKLSLDLGADMVAQVDDGKMPPPPPPPKFTVDAGMPTQVARATSVAEAPDEAGPPEPRRKRRRNRERSEGRAESTRVAQGGGSRSTSPKSGSEGTAESTRAAHAPAPTGDSDRVVTTSGADSAASAVPAVDAPTQPGASEDAGVMLALAGAGSNAPDSGAAELPPAELPVATAAPSEAAERGVPLSLWIAGGAVLLSVVVLIARRRR